VAEALVAVVAVLLMFFAHMLGLVDPSWSVIVIVSESANESESVNASVSAGAVVVRTRNADYFVHTAAGQLCMGPDARSWHMSLDEKVQQEEEDYGQHGDVDMPIPA